MVKTTFALLAIATSVLAGVIHERGAPGGWEGAGAAGEVSPPGESGYLGGQQSDGWGGWSSGVEPTWTTPCESCSAPTTWKKPTSTPCESSVKPTKPHHSVTKTITIITTTCPVTSTVVVNGTKTVTVPVTKTSTITKVLTTVVPGGNVTSTIHVTKESTVTKTGTQVLTSLIPVGNATSTIHVTKESTATQVATVTAPPQSETAVAPSIPVESVSPPPAPPHTASPAPPVFTGAAVSNMQPTAGFLVAVMGAMALL